jgi:hypothetical protein
MNRIQYEEIYTDTEKTKKRKQYHFILTRFAPVAACLLVGLLVWQPWGNSLIMRSGGDHAAMPAGAPMTDDERNTMSSVFGSDADDFEALPEEMAIITDSDMSDAVAGGNGLWYDSFDDGEAFNRLALQDIDLLREHIDGAYAEITITGKLPVLLESYTPQAFGPWFEWDLVFEIPSTEIQALLDELGSHEEFIIIHNNQNASSPYAMVFFSHEQ